MVGDGQYGAPLSVKYLSAPKDLYDNLILKQNILQKKHGPKITISQVDLFVTCMDTDYQKLNFEIADKCQWRQSKELVEEVKGLYEEYKSLIESSVARKVTPEKYIEIKEMASNQVKPFVKGATWGATPVMKPVYSLTGIKTGCQQTPRITVRENKRATDDWDNMVEQPEDITRI